MGTIDDARNRSTIQYGTFEYQAEHRLGGNNARIHQKSIPGCSGKNGLSWLALCLRKSDATCCIYNLFCMVYCVGGAPQG